jgi:hypothetical protein
MKLRRAWKPLLATALTASCAFGALVAAESLFDGGTTAADPIEPISQEQQPSPVPEHRRIAEEPTKPRFEGDLLGMYLGPGLAKAPPGAVERTEQLRSETTNCAGKFVHQPVDTAQRFDLDFTPPPGFVLQPMGVSSSGPVTSAVGICSETGAELGVSWDYVLSGYGRAIVIRTHPATVWELDVAAERVSTINAGGQEAILVAPVNPDSGYGSSAMVMFPRVNAFTYIWTGDVPLNDLLALAEAVGRALPTDVPLTATQD